MEAAYTLGLERLDDRAREVWEHLEVGEGGSQPVNCPELQLCVQRTGLVCVPAAGDA